MRQLTDAEQRCASIPELREQIAELEEALVAAGAARDAAAADAKRLDERLMSSERTLRELYASPSWRVTRPLRYIERRLTGA